VATDYPQVPPPIDALATALVVVDAHDQVAYLNAAAQTLLAVGVNQTLGRPLAEFIREPDDFLKLLERARRSGEPLAQRQLKLQPALRDDSQHIVDSSASPLESDRVLIEMIDTTRQQRINRDTALLTQLGGNRLMVRQLAHEIKNPLGGLRGAAQLLDRELPDGDLRDYTRLIIREADRLRSLVDNLLGPGRAPHKVELNPHEIVQHVFQLLAQDAPVGVTIRRDYDPSLPSIKVDRDQMIQAVLNLGRNAVQAVGTQGTVTLRTRAVVGATIGARRHRVVASVQIEDDGPGVPPEFADTIFYPLVTGRPDGTGLGLAVAQDIATRHDGLIEFDSLPGRTVFTLSLPLDGDTHG
jgi:two-component system, NtrC family, nitrogen regulation sensor histidine kinase GlnL